MNNDLISIVVPIYNVEKYLNRCINSLVNQTYNNLEIILVDDGSKDSSGKIADEWAKKDLRIVVYHKENGGLSDARNFGIKHSKGMYISFVDSDDYVDINFIEILYYTAIKFKTKISAIGIQMFSDTSKIVSYSNFDEDVQVFNTEEAISYLYNNNKYANYAVNKLYLRELFDGIEYPYGKRMEDLGTTFLLFDKCETVAYNPIPLYYYYQREDSILHTPDQQFWIDKFTLISQRYTYISKKYPNIYSNYLSFFYGALEGYPYISENDRKIAIEEAIKIWPMIKKSCDLKVKLKFLLVRYFPKLYIKVVKKV